MPTFVSVPEFKAYLGDAPASSDDAVLAQIINDVEALFASATGRTLDSFTDASDRLEVLDGTGTSGLYVDYPIAEDGLGSITMGYNAASPDETLGVTDPTVIAYGAGSRRITRVDGGVFGRCGHRRYIAVEYDSLADIPADAKLAIKSVAAMAYRRRGSEEMKSETLGSFYSYTKEDATSAATSDPFWIAAVAANARGQLV